MVKGGFFYHPILLLSKKGETDKKNMNFFDNSRLMDDKIIKPKG